MEDAVAVRKWHVGKIILLWAWGIGLDAFSLHVLESTQNFVLGTAIIVAIVGIFLVLSVITWKWLGGKEQ